MEDTLLRLLDCAMAERCCSCGAQLRWVIKRMDDADLGIFYELGLCKRCADQ